MATLYEIQPDDLEPIDFTHFDCWFEDEDEDDEEHTDEEFFNLALQIIDTWAVNLSIHINPPDFAKVGFDDGFDLVIMQILEHGYDVYKGSDFIEIYKPEGN